RTRLSCRPATRFGFASRAVYSRPPTSANVIGTTCGCPLASAVARWATRARKATTSGSRRWRGRFVIRLDRTLLDRAVLYTMYDNRTDKERSGMSEQAPTVQTVSASKARQEWSELLDQVYRRHARVLVEAEGVPVAAIVSAEDLEQLTHLEAQREADLGLLDETQAAFAGVPAEE